MATGAVHNPIIQQVDVSKLRSRHMSTMLNYDTSAQKLIKEKKKETQNKKRRQEKRSRNEGKEKKERREGGRENKTKAEKKHKKRSKRKRQRVAMPHIPRRNDANALARLTKKCCQELRSSVSRSTKTQHPNGKCKNGIELDHTCSTIERARSRKTKQKR